MAGRFTFSIDTEFATLDWGRIGVISDPSGTGARQLTILDGRLFPGKGHDFHKHVNQEEVIVVISGQIEQWIEQEKQILGAGDSVFIPPDIVHASFNVGDGEANIIAIFGPSLGENGFEMVDMSQEMPWRNLRRLPSN
jgi:quercetin dioxygenase-like cupin family protein